MKIFRNVTLLLIAVYGVNSLAKDIEGPTFYVNDNSYLKNKSGKKVITIDKDLIGLNILKTTTDIQRNKLIPLLKGKVNYLRWPGGTVTSFHSYFHEDYHAFKDPRVNYNKSNKGNPRNFTDFKEFIKLCNDVKAKPFTGIPLQPGYMIDPITKRAVWDPSGRFRKELKATIAKISPYVSTVYIDNEMGHPGGLYYSRFKRVMSPREHEVALASVIQTIKSVNPNLKIMPNSKKRDYLTWWSNISISDGYGWTKYNGSWDRSNPNDLQKDFLNKSFNKSLASISKDTRNYKNDFEKNGWSNSKFVRYEWNLAPNFSRKIKHEFGAAIWNAWNLSGQMRGGIDLSFFWPLYKNPLSSTSYNYKWSPNDFFPYFEENKLNGPISLAPSGHVIQVYSDTLSKKGKYLLLDSRINWGERTRAHSWSAHGTFIKHKSSGSLHGIIVNKEQKGWTTIQIELSNKNLAKYKNISAYALRNADAYKTGAPIYTRLGVSKRGNSIRLRMPPLSLISVRFDNSIKQYKSLKPSKTSNQNKSWYIDLGNNYDLDNLEIFPHGSAKRNYKIYSNISTLGMYGGNLVVERNDIGNLKRNVINEEIQTVGRYIRIDWPKKSAPSSLTVNVFGRKTYNLLSSSVVLDDANTGDRKNTISNIVDNNYHSVWRSTKPWTVINFDMNKVRKVSNIVIRWNTDEYAKEFELKHSLLARPNWINYKLSEVSYRTIGSTTYISFEDEVDMRRLKLILKKSPSKHKRLTIRKMFIYGR
jgi:hypothetical protein